MQGLELDYTALTEHTFGFMKNLAEVYGEDWAAQLPQCIPPIFEVRPLSIQYLLARQYPIPRNAPFVCF